MRSALKAVLVAAMTLVIAAPAQSQIRLYGGKYDRPDNAFAGVGYEIGVLPIIDVIPNYEYVFTSVGHFSSFNVDGVINFLWGNLVPVTIGNIVGALLFVSVLYWWVYLRSPLCYVEPAKAPAPAK
jgi:hypothetical protein